MHNISIIIPVLNEASSIVFLLEYLTKNSNHVNISEIIIVDGGSTDGSIEIAKAFENVIVLNSEKGRAKQMNCGAWHSKGNILYFLHADSFPPKHFDQFIINAVKNRHHAGCFKMAFDSKHWWLQMAGWFTQFRWRVCRGGDQSLFVLKSLFDDIGGYNEAYPIYEDYIFIAALYAKNEFVVINKSLTTSARLYEKHGVWKVQYHFFVIHAKKMFGSSASHLLKYYKKHLS